MDDPLKKAKEKAAATYDAAADHFDDEPLSFWDLIGKRTVTNLKLQAGAKVLDVGCGTGASALPAAQAVGKNGFVVGVDLASRLLERARTKALTAGLDNVEFRLADMTALEYPDSSFDAVVSVFSIFFVPDMGSLVRELWRMVRPGGKLAVTTWGPRIFEPVVIANTRDRTGVPYFGSWRRARKRWKNSKARPSPNLKVVVMTFAARHRRKSNKYSGGVPRSQNQRQNHQGQSLTSEKRGAPPPPPPPPPPSKKRKRLTRSSQRAGAIRARPSENR